MHFNEVGAWKAYVRAYYTQLHTIVEAFFWEQHNLNIKATTFQPMSI